MGIATAIVTGVAAALLLPPGFLGGALFTAAAVLWIAVAFGTLAAVIVVWAWSRAHLTAAERRALRTENAIPVGSVAYGTDGRIREAWLEGREPDVPVQQRLAAAAAARRTREVRPTMVRSALIGIPFGIASLLMSATFLIRPERTVSLGFTGIYALFGLGGLLTSLHALGRTTAPLATEPEVPERLLPDGRKKPVPRKLLGTDHPYDHT
ncbi:hypothetical protein [Frondihabitans sp. 762G35]|uniref:hypothetical protein n=1 Tax=Frondihabitans sp. 762G35 TaxID=1446794 RepID=UPI000E706B2E|nr:hypothetical protein [Frondihabitans sp. 762G35]